AIRVVPPARALGRGEPLGQDVALYGEWTAAAGRAFSSERFDVIHVFRRAALPFAECYQVSARSGAADWHLDLDDVESRSQARLAGLYARYGRAAEQADAERLAAEAGAFEGTVLRVWDRVYVCSALDRADLLARSGEHRAEVVVLPNVVALPVDPGPAPRGRPLTLLFVASFGHVPNADAAGWLCRQILPVLRERAPVPVRVLLVGSGVPPVVQDLDHIPEVHVVGPVPDVAAWYRQADIAVVPLRAGGGTRIKVLEALAHRRPVVSTALGAEGLDLVDGEHLLVADRAHHFAEQCLRLVTDAALAARLADAGRARVAARYGPGVPGEILSAPR
ncbi:MAG TPA: glycosyltransferase, partial [Thermomicrobiaceae bacterium]|nr:glycosyltransferase [Thermomicrobiaceae bacterium]